MPVLTPVETEIKQHDVIVPPPHLPDDFDGEGGSGGSRPGFPISKAQIAMWLLLTVVVMLFAGLSSAYIVLRGVPTWQNIAVPRLVWLNTLILIASSLTLESARRAVRKNNQSAIKLWVGASGLLGLAFLGGQLVVWRELVAAGVYLPSTLHSSFFYVLTGVHAVHLVGGIGGLSWVLYKSFQGQLTPSNHEPLTVSAMYWHFMDAIWLYLFLILMLA